MTRITWASDEVRLVPSFRVHPTSFRLERQYFIGDENGRTMTAYALSDEHRQLFASLREWPLSYRKQPVRPRGKRARTRSCRDDGGHAG